MKGLSNLSYSSFIEIIRKTRIQSSGLPTNESALPQDQNVFDSKKKVKLTNTEGVEYKLAKKQLQTIEFNKALLAMYTNQVISENPQLDIGYALKHSSFVFLQLNRPTSAESCPLVFKLRTRVTRDLS